MFNRMSPLSPRKKNNTPKNAAGFGVLQTGGRGIKGTPEGGPWAGEFGGGRFQVVTPCMGGDTVPRPGLATASQSGRGVQKLSAFRTLDRTVPFVRTPAKWIGGTPWGVLPLTVA